MMGICKLCDQHCELQKSHAIGRTIFREAFQSTTKNSFIRISRSENKVSLSTDQWSSYQLCSKCEKIFNERYENYSINALRGKRNCVSVKKIPLGISYTNLDQEKISLYFLSVLWRASESEHESYRNFKILDVLSSDLKNIFKENGNLPNNLFHVRVHILYDTLNLISIKGLKEIITTPSVRYTNYNIIYEMIFEGFYIEIYCKKPRNSELKRDKYGFLRNKKNIVLFPFIEFSKLENLINSLHCGVKQKLMVEPLL